MRAEFLLLALLFSSCAAPIEGLWPPVPSEPSHRITVAMDAWHSVIGVWPDEDPEGATWDGAREWGYADESFYLRGNDGLGGCCGALFWPTAAVLRVAPAGRSIIDTKDEPARRWTFRLSQKGHERLVAFLEEERRSEVISRIGGSEWFHAKTSYQMFHHCNHWAARALRRAGLPVWSSYAVFRWSLAMQLDRVAAWE